MFAFGRHDIICAYEQNHIVCEIKVQKMINKEIFACDQGKALSTDSWISKISCQGPGSGMVIYDITIVIVIVREKFSPKNNNVCQLQI